MLVELDPNAGLLSPIGVPVGEALGATTAEGFTPSGIPADVSADPVMEPPGGGNFADSDGVATSSEAGTEGGTTRGRRRQRLARPGCRTAWTRPARR